MPRKYHFAIIVDGGKPIGIHSVKSKESFIAELRVKGHDVRVEPYTAPSHQRKPGSTIRTKRRFKNDEDLKQFLLDNMIQQDNGCLVWTRGCNRTGYGVIGYKYDDHLVHRLFWSLSGRDLPDNMELLHSCDNPPCCNLDHLKLGTQQDNMLDRDLKNRVAHGETHCRAKLADSQVSEIKEMARSGQPLILIAKTFGVNPSHISRLVSGKRRSR